MQMWLCPIWDFDTCSPCSHLISFISVSVPQHFKPQKFLHWLEFTGHKCAKNLCRALVWAFPPAGTSPWCYDIVYAPSRKFRAVLQKVWRHMKANRSCQDKVVHLWHPENIETGNMCVLERMFRGGNSTEQEKFDNLAQTDCFKMIKWCTTDGCSSQACSSFVLAENLRSLDNNAKNYWVGV